jgi:ADP-dependent NAD(P)H-hydrate dehydratase / NAD(P)H-hydrate epimerase
MTLISTTNTNDVSQYLQAIHLPAAISHKGQNGKVLVIGGSSLFHGAILWAAEAASHIVDMVHVASTNENNEIIKKIKTQWQTGMVVPQKEIIHYADEDDVILIGNGMMRVGDEGKFTRELVYNLITHFPDKQFVLDAGALQMMDASWLSLLRKQAVITPHQKEFQTLFTIDLAHLSLDEKESVVQQTAHEYSCIILLKAVDDIISDGNRTIRIHGGNAGLTKGGTGDILAGLVSGMSATSDTFSSAIVASFLLKKNAEKLFHIQGYWYTARDILSLFPSIFYSLTKDLQKSSRV